jgi:TonB family protein
MLDFILRALIVGGLATCAAWLFERALRNACLGVRHAWTASLMATTTLPFLPRIFETTSTLPVPAITLPAIAITDAPVTAASPVDYTQLAWMLLAVTVACIYVLAYARLRRARRGWRRELVAEHDVDVSDRFGPAIFGFIRPRIVVPQWVRTADAAEQRLIVKHEREHIEARDHLLLLLTLITTVVMPWNPFIWLQTRRLCFALEADCDRRVLAAIPDRTRYAALLVDVGSRQMGLFLTPALAEHRNGLERRIIMLAERIRKNWWKAGTLAVLGIGITIVACESRLPHETNSRAEAVVTEDRPIQGESVNFIDREYPPLLRGAGIGGTVSLRVHVTEDGEADRVLIARTSGHDALDAAAARVARQYPWGTDGMGSTAGYWVKTSVTFDPEIGGTMEKRPSIGAEQVVPDQGLQSKQRIPEKPEFTPYTTRPALVNRDETSRALVRAYPPELRDAGIAGKVVIWVLIDDKGSVVKTDVKTSSGVPALDAAARRVGRSMKFSAALNGKEPVPVWIALPVVFKTQ